MFLPFSVCAIAMVFLSLMNRSCPSLARMSVLMNIPMALQLFNGVLLAVTGSADVGLLTLNRIILTSKSK